MPKKPAKPEQIAPHDERDCDERVANDGTAFVSLPVIRVRQKTGDDHDKNRKLLVFC